MRFHELDTEVSGHTVSNNHIKERHGLRPLPLVKHDRSPEGQSKNDGICEPQKIRCNQTEKRSDRSGLRGKGAKCLPNTSSAIHVNTIRL